MEVKVKWSGKIIVFEVPEDSTMEKLKLVIYEKTQIRPDRQKIIGIKFIDTDLIKESDFIIL